MLTTKDLRTFYN